MDNSTFNELTALSAWGCLKAEISSINISKVTSQAFEPAFADAFDESGLRGQDRYRNVPKLRLDAPDATDIVENAFNSTTRTWATWWERKRVNGENFYIPYFVNKNDTLSDLDAIAKGNNEYYKWDKFGEILKQKIQKIEAKRA